jgi:hypothetical protein
MKNISNSTNLSTIKTFPLFIVYYPLVLIIIGTILNLFTLIILCRTSFKNTKKRPTLYYMRAIAILDILILYGWNLDHYLEGTTGIKLDTYSVISCKFFSFINYFTYQVSAWLRVFICFDRYLSLSSLHRTWFSVSKNVLIIIGILIIVFILINFHFLPFVCYYKNDQVIIESLYYMVYPMWDLVNLIIYNCLPFVLMVIFNTGVIYHLILLRRISTVGKNSRIQHRAISATLLITTCLFFLMTTPVSIAYAYFSDTNESILYTLDSILYTYHILSFPIYFLTFAEFRREFFKLITLDDCRKRHTIPTIHFSEPSQTDKPNTNILNRLFTISHTSLK